MAQPFEQKLIELLQSLIELKTIIETELNTSQNEILTDFYRYKKNILNLHINQIQELIQKTKGNPPIPLLMAYIKSKINTDTYYSYSELSRMSIILQNFKMTRKADIPQGTINKINAKSNNLLSLIENLIQEINEKTSYQHKEQVIIGTGKKANLTITYGGPQTEGTPLLTILKEAKYEYDIAQQIINTLNQKIKISIKWVLNAEFFEKIFGSTFTTNIQVYITQESNETAGYLKRITKWIKQKIKTNPFVPTIEDIRFQLDIDYILETTLTNLESTILHEITHIFDKNIIYRKETETNQKLRTILDKIREEGLARFNEVINNPILLQRFKNHSPETWTKLQNTKFNSQNELIQENIKDKQFAYVTGLYMMLQLFLQLTKNDKKTPADLTSYQISPLEKQALNLLNMVRIMDTNKFFQYYQKKVSQPIFTKKFFEEI